MQITNTLRKLHERLFSVSDGYSKLAFNGPWFCGLTVFSIQVRAYGAHTGTWGEIVCGLIVIQAVISLKNFALKLEKLN